MSTAPLQLAIVGHTNTGKTSLLRTLSRDSALGEIADRPATTRQVEGTLLLASGTPVLALYDTPGLEDASGLQAYLEHQPPARDRTAGIEAFLAGDHDHGRYEQEAKVLRQLLHSDAGLYVIDAREPMLDKHRDELRLLADCGRPLMPLLNFVADTEADAPGWRQQLARMGLHVLADFDTVAFDLQAEQQVFEKLGLLLEDRKAALQQLVAARRAERTALIDSAARAIAELLVNVAGARLRVDAGADADAAQRRLRERVRVAEQACVDLLLGLFRFDLGAYEPPTLPLEEGRWQLDPFDPQALRALGLRTGSAAAIGGAAGLSIDALTGGLSLGAGALLGAGVGAVWSVSNSLGRQWADRWRGHQWLAVDASALAVISSRQLQLLQALLRRGHAAQTPLRAAASRGWPSAALREQVLRCRAHPHWSALNASAGSEPPPEAVIESIRRTVLAAMTHAEPGSTSP